MRLPIVVILSIAVGLSVSSPAPALAPAPLDGAWMACETYRGAKICSYKLLVQRGSRVCGVQRYFATSAYYEQRFVGTVKGHVAQIEKICGDPGSETDTYCTGRAPRDAENIGWGTSTEKLFQCRGRLFSASGDAAVDCKGVMTGMGMPRVRSLGGEGPAPEDRAWLASCTAGRE
ncbi:hypothetical protein [Sphingopyxis sp.]|uniref:hypothetical protein n=1 Tax=Sphingopyxis sp. TaxID=1908224 RepID=UPI003F71D99F